MRPVNKGEHPTTPRHPRQLRSFNDPSNAKDDLVQRLGPYCSYCERFYSKSALNVEHVLPKEKGMYPELISEWENFLLACTPCNSSKNAYVQRQPLYQDAQTGRCYIHHFDLNDFVWPHLHNTYEAFEYDEDGNVSPNAAAGQAAVNTVEMLNLNRRAEDESPDGDDILLQPPAEDARLRRRRVWQEAQQALEIIKAHNDERSYQQCDQPGPRYGSLVYLGKSFSSAP